MCQSNERIIPLIFLFAIIATLNINLTFADVDNPLPATQERVVGDNREETKELRQSSFYEDANNDYGSSQKRSCPLCDSSVYPYCGDKFFHDACCCTDPYKYPLPQKCRFADCAFLHANSCWEHKLIANCCCSDDYRSLLVKRGGKPDTVNDSLNPLTVGADKKLKN